MKTDSSKRTKILLGILVLCVVAWFLTKPSSQVEIDSSVVVDAGVAASAVALLQEVQAVDFDFSLFQKQEFLQLVNRNMPFLNLPVGKSDPFAPSE
jgi:hypothetical protein